MCIVNIDKYVALSVIAFTDEYEEELTTAYF